jgi:protein LTV1
MQHLRAVGVQEDGVNSILIEAPARKDNKGKTKSDTLFIPKEALPSASELPRNYESQQAVPQSIAGLQPDMDPHLRQALEALEDDAFIDDDLGEIFFDELVEDGERESDDHVQFEFAEYGIEDEIDDSSGQGRKIENEGVNWEERFALFRKNREDHDQKSTSDDEFAFEENDTIGSLLSISVIGGKGKRRRMGSDASGYSMSSSSMYRNQALQTLDERFDQVHLQISLYSFFSSPSSLQVMGKQYHEQYHEENEESSPSDDDDEAPELITSREDFSTMVDEFLHDYEILGSKMKLKLEGRSGAEKLETLRCTLGQGDRVHVYPHENDDAQDLEDTETSEKGDRWDCETILSLLPVLYRSNG